MVTLALEWATMIRVPDGRPKELAMVTTRSKPFTEAEAPVEVMVIFCSFTIPGVGYVIVNEQKITITSTGASASVNGFDLVVTMANSFGLPSGTRIIVAHSNASVTIA